MLQEDVNCVAVLEVVVTDLVISSQSASIKAMQRWWRRNFISRKQ